MTKSKIAVQEHQLTVTLTDEQYSLYYREALK